jgi:hypothetical protein
MRHERQLVAIRDPAPSIPARFRLYHGGTSRRGYLVTQSSDSNAYLGEYVYFSSLKWYAREYLHPRRGVPAALFVIDARYLPAGDTGPSEHTDDVASAMGDGTNFLPHRHARRAHAFDRDAGEQLGPDPARRGRPAGGSEQGRKLAAGDLALATRIEGIWQPGRRVFRCPSCAPGLFRSPARSRSGRPARRVGSSRRGVRLL